MKKIRKCEYCNGEIPKEKRNRKFCSTECHDHYRTKESMERLRIKNNIYDFEEWLHQRYTIEQKSYRVIMKLLGTKNNRIIKELLVYYDIPIRYGSEAVKTQWIDNDSRRKQQSRIFKKSSTGNARKRLSFEEIKERYLKRDMRVLRREIIDFTSRIHYQCLKCGGVSYQTLGSDRGCSHCFPVSYGEETIRDYLDNNNFRYVRQYTTPNCRHINPLPFDFGVFSNKKLIALIEYQGRQHYEVVEHWGGQKGLEERKRNDNIKKNYCKANNIPLIEIPYTVEDIEGYLENELTQINNAIQLSIL